MRIIGLIAWREFLENIRTRGFWVGVLLLPVLFVGALLMQSRLADIVPTRHFLLIDQSGRYADAVAGAVALEHQRDVLQAFVDYLLTYRREQDPEQTLAGAGTAADRFIDDVDADEAAALDTWLNNGGLDVVMTMVRPALRADAPVFTPPPPRFVAASLPPEINPLATAEEILDQLRPYLNGDRFLATEAGNVSLYAFVFIPADIDGQIQRPGVLPQPGGARLPGVQYWARNLTDVRLPDAIERAVNTAVRHQALTALGVDPAQVRDAQRTRLPLSRLDPGAATGEEQVSIADTLRQYAPMAFVYLMFIALMQSVQYLLGNTIEEKSSRVIEVLLASVTPHELMLGKLVGIGLSSLTTVGTWIVSLLAYLMLYPGRESELISSVLEVVIGSELIPWFLFYTLAGYLLYAGLFLAIGSLCNTLKEAQALMMPVVLIMVVPITMMPFVVQDPDNPLYRVLSWIPWFTPYLMMNRAAADPPLMDIIGSGIGLLLGIVATLWAAGRIFRHGLLRNGQPPRFAELLGLLRRE